MEYKLNKNVTSTCLLEVESDMQKHPSSLAVLAEKCAGIGGNFSK
jgi:hypothetical protein